MAAAGDGFLPVDRRGMEALGWDVCDAVIVTGDAYVDHPSFGAALIGRHLESLGHRVGIIAQPDWKDPGSLLALGVPRLFVGITSGAMDSMVNHYTSFGRIRSDDAYTPGGRAGARPDRAVTVYANAVRRAMPGVPIVLGGIEASLRRLSHYDFWSGRMRRSILLDTRADILVYGMGERQIAEIAARLSEGRYLDGIPGTAVWKGASRAVPPEGAVVLPSHEAVCSDPSAFLEMTLAVEAEASPWCGRPLVQMSDTRMTVVHPPAEPLSGGEMDALYALPFTRRPHPSYTEPVPAWEMIRDSVTAVRGCAGGCSFCALGLHQGKHLVSRSSVSVLGEVRILACQDWFRGTVSDIGGPTANMYGLRCTNPEAERKCRRPSCLFPSPCPNFPTDQTAYADLLDAAAGIPGVKRTLVGSGLRLDLAALDPAFVRRLARGHVGGHLKVAPEHFSERVLELMRKPGIATWRRFLGLFREASAGREQYVLPYVMAAFPGCTMRDMEEAAEELRRCGLSPRQVQAFLPTPMTLAACMYATGLSPDGRAVDVARKPSEKKRQIDVLLGLSGNPGKGLEPDGRRKL